METFQRTIEEDLEYMNGSGGWGRDTGSPACGGMGLRQGAEEQSRGQMQRTAIWPPSCYAPPIHSASGASVGVAPAPQTSEHCSMSSVKTQALGWLTVQPSTWLGELHQGRKHPFRVREVGAEGLDSWAFASSPTSPALSHPLSFLSSFYDVTSRHCPHTPSSPAVCSSAS